MNVFLKQLTPLLTMANLLSAVSKTWTLLELNCGEARHGEYKSTENVSPGFSVGLKDQSVMPSNYSCLRENLRE